MRRRGYHVCEEPGRAVVKEQTATGGAGLPWLNGMLFARLCVEHAIRAYADVIDVLSPVLFDRSPLDNIAGISASGERVPADLANVLEDYRYDPVAFFVPPWEEIFESDSERRHGFADAKAEYERLLVAYPEAGYTIRVIKKVSVTERADAFEAEIKKGF